MILMANRSDRTRGAEALRKRGVRLSRQRAAVADVFFETDDHLTAPELWRRIRAHQPSIGLATVYRTLSVLVENQLAALHPLDEGGALYEPRLTGDHHDHLVCTRCGLLIEFLDPDLERLQVTVASSHGFTLRDHRVKLFGHCRDTKRCDANIAARAKETSHEH